MLFFKKRPDPSQPHPDWPWTLDLGGEPSMQLSWDILESELRELNLEDPDSFLILEQHDPAAPDNEWFIQSAINRAGPFPGWYTVEVGWNSPKGRYLRGLDVQTVEEVIPYFRAAWDRRPIDLTKLEDRADELG